MSNPCDGSAPRGALSRHRGERSTKPPVRWATPSPSTDFVLSPDASPALGVENDGAGGVRRVVHRTARVPAPCRAPLRRESDHWPHFGVERAAAHWRASRGLWSCRRGGTSFGNWRGTDVPKPGRCTSQSRFYRRDLGVGPAEMVVSPRSPIRRTVNLRAWVGGTPRGHSTDRRLLPPTNPRSVTDPDALQRPVVFVRTRHRSRGAQSSVSNGQSFCPPVKRPRRHAPPSHVHDTGWGRALPRPRMDGVALPKTDARGPPGVESQKQPSVGVVGHPPTVLRRRNGCVL